VLGKTVEIWQSRGRGGTSHIRGMSTSPKGLIFKHGWMAEWLKAPVLKTGRTLTPLTVGHLATVGRGLVGSMEDRKANQDCDDPGQQGPATCRYVAGPNQAVHALQW
jgi:hypothetical protein